MIVTNRFLQLLDSSRCRPVVIAHRGDSFHAPENTLEAGRLGWEAGADAWELDVQATRDGVAVVLHDETLTRTTDVVERFRGDARSEAGYRLSDFEWSEVRALDAGSWFYSEPGGSGRRHALGTLAHLRDKGRIRGPADQVRIPTLVEALALTAELDWLVNVELKSFPGNPQRLTEAVLDAISRTGTSDRVLLSSFDHRELARVPRLISPEDHDLLAIPRGVLARTPLSRPGSYIIGCVGGQTYHASASSLGAESIAYRNDPSSANLEAEELADLEAAGIPVLVYTVNDTRTDGLAQHLAELGVDALFTDDPRGMRDLFR